MLGPAEGPTVATNPNQSPLKPLVTGWLQKSQLAEELKKKEFGDDAEECLRFFNGPYSSAIQ
jgi:hypothetical protein